MIAAAIEVSGMVFMYPGVRALDDVSFTVPGGSVTALVGPNGAGKTTLLRCLAGLEQPMLGSVAVAGIDVLESPRAAHRRLGYLSDFFGLYDALSVRRCLMFAAAAHGVDAGNIAPTVERTAARIGLSDRLDQRCGELSRGLRQRVAIGQAIVHAPQVLLLDEPASGLDPAARHALARLFTELRNEGMTLVVSSHILAELDEYSTHMLVMLAGRIVEHRALDPGEQDETRIRIALANDVPGWGRQFEAFTEVRVVELGEREAVIGLRGGLQVQHRVLRDLIQAGLPVAGFAEERENLHASYLRTVSAKEGGA